MQVRFCFSKAKIHLLCLIYQAWTLVIHTAELHDFLLRGELRSAFMLCPWDKQMEGYGDQDKDATTSFIDMAGKLQSTEAVAQELL